MLWSGRGWEGGWCAGGGGWGGWARRRDVEKAVEGRECSKQLLPPLCRVQYVSCCTFLHLSKIGVGSGPFPEKRRLALALAAVHFPSRSADSRLFRASSDEGDDSSFIKMCCTCSVPALSLIRTRGGRVFRNCKDPQEWQRCRCTLITGEADTECVDWQVRNGISWLNKNFIKIMGERILGRERTYVAFGVEPAYCCGVPPCSGQARAGMDTEVGCRHYFTFSLCSRLAGPINRNASGRQRPRRR